MGMQAAEVFELLMASVGGGVLAVGAPVEGVGGEHFGAKILFNKARGGLSRSGRRGRCSSSASPSW
jgi:hypothetical protein